MIGLDLFAKKNDQFILHVQFILSQHTGNGKIWWIKPNEHVTG
jgi:hypothetical protein